MLNVQWTQYILASKISPLHCPETFDTSNVVPYPRSTQTPTKDLDYIE